MSLKKPKYNALMVDCSYYIFHNVEDYNTHERVIEELCSEEAVTSRYRGTAPKSYPCTGEIKSTKYNDIITYWYEWTYVTDAADYLKKIMVEE